MKRGTLRHICCADSFRFSFDQSGKENKGREKECKARLYVERENE